MSSKSLACALLVVLCTGSLATRAADYKSEYDKKVKASQDIGALGNDLAGDSINYYNGATSFSAVDLSVPGNNALPVAIGRRYSVDLEHTGWGFADWELDIPYLSTVMTAAGGWATTAATPINRCSVNMSTAVPASVTVNQDGGGFHTFGFFPDDYWHGYTAHLPGGEQPMLIPAAANSVRPTTGGPYYWTTNRDWWFSCIPGTATDPSAGEGFIALAPDGTRYRFDRMVVNGASDITSTDNYGGPQTWHFTLPRAEYRLYVSRIDDRFGNWVQYNWAGAQLNSITSSDGRTISLTWSGGAVSSVSDGARTVNYAYSGGSLSTVTHADGSYWQYGFTALSSIVRPEPAECYSQSQPLAYWDCYGGVYSSEVNASGWVRHPSGARIDFTFGQRYRYSASSSFYGYQALMLLQKTVSGAGVASGTWKYGIAPGIPETRTACRAGTCPTHVTSDEIGPDGSVTRRVFGSVRGLDESLLQGELRGAVSSGLQNGGTGAITCSARWGCDVLDDVSPVTGTVPVFYTERDLRYVAPDAFPVGTNPMVAGETFASSRRMPTNAQYRYERGATLATVTQAFDEFAHATQLTRTSTGLAGPLPGYSRSESMTYLNDLSQWVIGLPLATTVGGVEASRTDYHATLRLPIKSYRYGLSQGELSYNADGTLASVKDPRGNVTSLSGWVYGVPASIVFPASGGVSTPTMTAGISAPGRIDWTTNEVGAKTCYAYDSMFRMSGVTYTSEVSNGTCDVSAWSPSSRGFVWEPASEYGLPAGHWKQTVATGTGKSTTLFNALWQPALTITEDTANSATRSFVVNRYDSMGRKIFASYPVASATVNDALLGIYTDYDVLGRPWRTRQDSELGTLTSMTLYLTGFQTRATNPRGFSTTTSFQLFDDPSANAPVRIEAPQGVTTVITRDEVGNPLQITRSGPAG